MALSNSQTPDAQRAIGVIPTAVSCAPSILAKPQTREELSGSLSDLRATIGGMEACHDLNDFKPWDLNLGCLL
jgi:hypothetical protein